MTTVVYRDGILAADSALTDEHPEGGHIQYQCKKLYSYSDAHQGYPRTHYVGFSGGQGWRKFLDWVRAGANLDVKPEFEKGDDFTAIVISVCAGVRQRYVIGRHMEPEPLVEDFHAVGSGAKCAFGALDMGADAVKAVEIAAGRDPYTRGPFVKLPCV